VLTHHEANAILQESVTRWGGVQLTPEQGLELVRLQLAVITALEHSWLHLVPVEDMQERAAEAAELLRAFDPHPFP
jgi:hypothetical protein